MNQNKDGPEQLSINDFDEGNPNPDRYQYLTKQL